MEAVDLIWIMLVKGDLSKPFICLFKYTHAPQPGNWPQDPVCRTGFPARSSVRKDLDVDDWQWLTVVHWWFQLFEYTIVWVYN